MDDARDADTARRKARLGESREQDIARRQEYLRQLAARRLEAAGVSGHRAARAQRAIYKALGLDLNAGCEGRPPAFRAESAIRIGREVLVSGIRNYARDPLHRLRTNGDISEQDHRALAALVDLFERHASAGLRAAGLTEAVDGGKLRDMSAYVLDVAGAMIAFERAFAPEERGILIDLAINGMSISEMARAGTYGSSRNTVKARLRKALDKAVRYFLD